MGILLKIEDLNLMCWAGQEVKAVGLMNEHCRGPGVGVVQWPQD
jgi:hypothetical protein